MSDDLQLGIRNEAASVEGLMRAKTAAAHSEGDVIVQEMSPDSALHLLDTHLRRAARGEFGSRSVGRETLAELVDRYNRLLHEIDQMDGRDPSTSLTIPVPPQEIIAITSAGQPAPSDRPTLSLDTGALFTGRGRSGGTVADELRKEILTADRIDILVSFIKQSGLNLIYDALVEFTETRPLRVITTTYMGASDPAAVEKISQLPNTEVKVSYDIQTTRLHAKAYLFHRDSGYSTALIGSSNLSGPAVSTGLEWNIRSSSIETPEIWATATIAFDEYWYSLQFHPYEPVPFADAIAALRASAPKDHRSFISQPRISPFPFQQTILDKLEAERVMHGRNKNLVVAATGTGKTVIAAFDYRRFRDENPEHARLLFVAESWEILRQARDTFRNVLQDFEFGVLGTDIRSTTNMSSLFVTIDSFNSRKVTAMLPTDFYDFIVLDESHHIAAPSYQNLLEHFTPAVLLGLTATPERMDGNSIYKYFDDHSSAEIRLPEAIDRGLLVPFQYFCIDDETDLSAVKFATGSYDAGELEFLYLHDDRRVRLVLSALSEYLPDPQSAKALCFCVSVKHALFMNDRFLKAGLRSAVIVGTTSQVSRQEIVEDFKAGRISFLFVVDVFNEGVDIPEIDTAIFLRPTESLTVFLQQLGRGLRHADGKQQLTVMDFVGRANGSYSYAEKFRALLMKSRRTLRSQIESQEFDLPRGCELRMDEIVQSEVLSRIDSAINLPALKRRIGQYRASGGAADIGEFLTFNSDISPTDLYRTTAPKASPARSFRSLYAAESESAGVLTERTLGRIATIDSFAMLKHVIAALQAPAGSVFTDARAIALEMLYYATNDVAPSEIGFNHVGEWLDATFSDSALRAEALSLANHQLATLDFVSKPITLGYAHGLELHASYRNSREILAGLRENTLERSTPFREGVIYLSDISTDVFFVTLNKDETIHRPTTMYRDYAVSETVFHWETQNRTAPDTPTGLRYQQVGSEGVKALLFVRITDNDPFCFLGPVEYLTHSDSKPMKIMWQLPTPIPENILLPAQAIGAA